MINKQFSETVYDPSMNICVLVYSYTDSCVFDRSRVAWSSMIMLSGIYTMHKSRLMFVAERTLILDQCSKESNRSTDRFWINLSGSKLLYFRIN